MQGVQSYAAKAREPRQVRKEAAVSGFSHVPQGFLTGAGYAGTAWGGRSEISARPIFVYRTYIGYTVISAMFDRLQALRFRRNEACLILLYTGSGVLPGGKTWLIRSR